MREIKFRAWDKTTNYMDYRVRVISIEGDTHIAVMDGFTNWRSLKKYECKLMQYTGLKDKNGKEIYEGDILEFGDISGMGNMVYDKENLQYRLKIMGVVKLDVKVKIDKELVEEANMRIIGNIYENPELLVVE